MVWRPYSGNYFSWISTGITEFNTLKAGVPHGEGEIKKSAIEMGLKFFKADTEYSTLLRIRAEIDIRCMYGKVVTVIWPTFTTTRHGVGTVPSAYLRISVWDDFVKLTYYLGLLCMFRSLWITAIRTWAHWIGSTFSPYTSTDFVLTNILIAVITSLPITCRSSPAQQRGYRWYQYLRVKHYSCWVEFRQINSSEIGLPLPHEKWILCLKQTFNRSLWYEDSNESRASSAGISTAGSITNAAPIICYNF